MSTTNSHLLLIVTGQNGDAGHDRTRFRCIALQRLVYMCTLVHIRFVEDKLDIRNNAIRSVARSKKNKRR
jgi:hypothetical protein